jgi:hypothetical protein
VRTVKTAKPWELGTQLGRAVSMAGMRQAMAKRILYAMQSDLPREGLSSATRCAANLGHGKEAKRESAVGSLPRDGALRLRRVGRRNPQAQHACLRAPHVRRECPTANVASRSTAGTMQAYSVAGRATPATTAPLSSLPRVQLRPPSEELPEPASTCPLASTAATARSRLASAGPL